LDFGLAELDGPENQTLTGLLATPLRELQRIGQPAASEPAPKVP
jgi:hypothetical protein